MRSTLAASGLIVLLLRPAPTWSDNQSRLSEPYSALQAARWPAPSSARAQARL